MGVARVLALLRALECDGRKQNGQELENTGNHEDFTRKTLGSSLLNSDFAAARVGGFTAARADFTAARPCAIVNARKERAFAPQDLRPDPG